MNNANDNNAVNNNIIRYNLINNFANNNANIDPNIAVEIHNNISIIVNHNPQIHNHILTELEYAINTFHPDNGLVQVAWVIDIVNRLIHFRDFNYNNGDRVHVDNIIGFIDTLNLDELNYMWRRLSLYINV
jgi:hypothetical protein